MSKRSREITENIKANNPINDDAEKQIKEELESLATVFMELGKDAEPEQVTKLYKTISKLTSDEKKKNKIIQLLRRFSIMSRNFMTPF